MKILSLLATAFAISIAVPVGAADMADELTIVSFGGAYTKSQINAYHDPYAAKTGITIINDDSAAEAVAKVRAMNEAGDITWDLVDVSLGDAQRLCDEGLAVSLDLDDILAPAPDGTPATEDFGHWVANDCFIPTIVFATTFGYRTDLVGDTLPTSVCDVFDLEKYPGQRSLQKRPIDNMQWALVCDGV